MSVADELLTQAQSILDGATIERNRMACWVTRSALEEVIDDLLSVRNFDAAGATTRSRLSCLQVAYTDKPEIPARAEYTWARLSQACHQHAYQLTPTHSEARHFLALVRSLVDVAGRATPSTG